MDNYQEAIEYLAIDSPNEEIDDFKVCVAQTIAELEEVIAAEDAGEMTDEEADAEIAEILVEHNEKALDIFDLEEVAVEENKVEYSDIDDNIASFSEGLGSVLSGLIAEEYENPNDGILDLVDATGSDSDTITAIINGDAVPDPVMGQQMGSLFDSLSQDNNAYQEWNDLVSRAYSEVANEFELETQSNPEAEAAIATMAANQNILLSEFSQMKSQAELAEELRILEAQADSLVSNGILTPFERKDLLGEYGQKEDAIALFSAACDSLNTPPQVQLDRIKFYLHMRQRCGQTAMFSEMSEGSTQSSYSLSKQDQSFISEMLDEVIG